MADLVTVDRSTWERQRREAESVADRLRHALERLAQLDTANAALRRRVAELEPAEGLLASERLNRASAVAELAVLRGKVRELAKTLEGWAKTSHTVPAGKVRGVVGKLRAVL